MDIQELIARGRFIFNGAPKRLDAYKQVNGRKNAKEIAKIIGRNLSSTLADLQKIKNIGLITFKEDKEGNVFKIDDSLVYDKTPLAKSISISYFKDPIRSQKSIKKIIKQKGSRIKVTIAYPSIPVENEIIDICRMGEGQIHEFKTSGTEIKKITEEIAAMLHNKEGGLIFYGVEDNGDITGTDKRGQEMDQPLQNSVRNSIDPSPPAIEIKRQTVAGHEILVFAVPSWNKKEVYHLNHKVYIRKGTNVFPAKAADTKKLYQGTYLY